MKSEPKRQFKYIYSYQFPTELEDIISESIFAGKIPTVALNEKPNYPNPPQKNKSKLERVWDYILWIISFGPEERISPYDGVCYYLMDPTKPNLLYEYISPYELYANQTLTSYALEVEPEWLNLDLVDFGSVE